MLICDRLQIRGQMISPRKYNNKKPLLRTVASSLVLAECFCQSTLADTHSETNDSVEEIVVTGSRIARRDFSAPSPVVTLEAAEFKLAGSTTAEELLNTLPQVIPDRDRTTNNGGGTASINLRGLGRDRTLVLLNGRRFSASEIRGGVDINNFPAALIERVEIVTGGASAVYGSDAVVGVVNFVIDNHFDGLQINAQYDVTHENDGEVFDVSISAGTSFADGRGHVSGFFNYNDRQTLLAGDREFTSVVIEDDTTTGELFEAGSSAVPETAILFPDTTINGTVFDAVLFNQDGTLRPANFPEDLYNYAPITYLQVPLERYAAASFLSFDFTSKVRGELEVLFARSRVVQQFAPTPVSLFGFASIDSPFLPPETQQILSDNFDPDGDGLAEFFIRRRLEEIEPRQVDDTRNVVRVLAGLDGDIRNSWEWQAWYSWTETDVDPLFHNAVSQSRFEQSLFIDPATGGCLDPSGGCVPANIWGAGNVSDEAAEFIRFGTVEDEEVIEEQIASAVVIGDLWRLPAGPLAVAVGLEWRRLEAVFTPDPATAAGDIVGSRGFQPAIGATEVKEIFAEVLVPLATDIPFARYLAVEAGARVSNYNTAGTVDTWKLGSEWIPIDGLRFRAMYQRATRAPSVLEIFEKPTEGIRNGFTADIDLCSASRDPVGNGLTDVCVAQGLDPALIGVFEAPDPNFFTLFIGGNPDLKPEESTSFTIGFTAQPTNIENFSISLDYFDIEIEDAIEDIQAGALAACFALKDPTSNLCTGYVRGPAGNIVEANNYPRNVAVQRSEGVDLQLLYTFDADGLALFEGVAKFDLAINATWYLTNGSRTSPITPFFDCVGHFGFTCAFSNFGTLPELKATTRLTYTSGPMQASLRWRWVDGMKNSETIFTELFNLPDPVLAIPEIGSTSYIDFSGTYQLTDKVLAYGGINNLFNNGPPLLAGAANGINTDASTFDVIGRRYFLGVTYRY